MRRLPSSLWFVTWLGGFGVLGSLASFVVQQRQETAQQETHAQALTDGVVERGERAIIARQCNACHEIPGMAGARGAAAPSLGGFAARKTVAGVLRNDPVALVRWVRFPQSVVPGNAMPNMGIGDQEARDIAAYLYTLSPRPT
ncbi:c-type cytochrome [Sphingobium sp. EP60837]|uniref:c-type cytochrome n=1 Tax=Sphingobium sp. EP60837 TaxID=1855519 RepID=UPI0007DDE5A7|nr:c-type cytochrome [Sphingobium sp. EP60837]ANI79487.1 Cytochrome-c oxidase [Sphingobium sp. EP60837]